MLPFDNKSELQVIVHMPEDTPLETTAASRPRSPTRRCTTTAVTSVQSYTGTSSPYTFNGLVRHYFLRRQPNLADLQVMLVDKDERNEQSHAIAKRHSRRGSIRSRRGLGARIQVVEVPPGPPVLQTLVAEVYGPDPQRRLELARTVRSTFEQTPASSTSTGTSNRRSRKWQLDVDAREGRGRRAVERRGGRGRADGRRRRAGRPAARSQAREDVPIVAAAAARAARIARRGARLRLGRGRRSPSAS